MFSTENIPLCDVMTQKLCTKCDVSQIIVECFKEQAQCARQVVAKLRRDHEATWICDDEEVTRKNDGVKASVKCTTKKYEESIDRAKRCSSTTSGDELFLSNFANELSERQNISS